MEDHLQDCDICGQLLQYVYNTQMHKSTNLTPFSLGLWDIYLVQEYLMPGQCFQLAPQKLHLPFTISTMPKKQATLQQDGEKGMKTAHWRFERNHSKNICNGHRGFTPDSTCRLTEYQSQPLLQRDSRLRCTGNECFSKVADSE